MRSIKFSPEAWEDYQYWQSADKKITRRILVIDQRFSAQWLCWDGQA
jgi:Txe/YoeB family toxin of Txe-Axe toxin-antitoxin module